LRRQSSGRIDRRIVFDPEEFDSALDDLEVRLEGLHLLFERFFSGSELREPVALREEVDQQLAALLLSQRNLGALARVRLTILHQRYDSYQQCWERLAGRPGGGSIPPPKTGSLTPPLGTPSSAPLASDLDPRLEVGRTPSGTADSARTIRDFRAPPLSDSARTRPDLRPAFENPSSGYEPPRTQPRLPLPFSVDSSSTAPYLRLPEEDEARPKTRADAFTPTSPQVGFEDVSQPAEPDQDVESGRQVSMDRVREIHARLRASNSRPPSLERLAKRLSETEAKLKALHGDRTVTFDVVLRDGKAIVKPIVH
jgi:hypothetical protein